MAVFSQRLKVLRQNRKVLQKDIADVLNISTRQYSSYESEKQNVDVPLSKLLLLADYFNVSLDYLTGRCDIETEPMRNKPVHSTKKHYRTALKVARSKSNATSHNPIVSVTDDFSDLLNSKSITNDNDL